MQAIVKVGAVKETRDEYSECEGYSYYGPMPIDEAAVLVLKLGHEFARLQEEHGAEAFVYGPPTAEMIRLMPDLEPVTKIARNWILTEDEKEMLSL